MLSYIELARAKMRLCGDMAGPGDVAAVAVAGGACTGRGSAAAGSASRSSCSTRRTVFPTVSSGATERETDRERESE
jgi:hypothetical protein